MITFLISLVALVLGYVVYGRFVERVFAPDDRMTPAVAKADGLDYVAMPYWKVFMIQFLNIAGTGPIFGAIMGGVLRTMNIEPDALTTGDKNEFVINQGEGTGGRS